MRFILTILLNALILYALSYFMSGNENIDAGIIVTGGYVTFLIGGVILGLLNFIVKPILKVLSLPFYLFSFFLVGFIVNGVILKLFEKLINDIINIPGISFQIVGITNFIISVAIFGILNIILGLLKFKK